MQLISMQEVQKGSLEILKRIDKICAQLKLKYCLAYGTLIGAIRHKGFIPWDDDVDIMMPRKDYDSLVQYFIDHKEELKQFIGAEAELPDMLNARERRVWVQEKLLAEYSGVLVSFTLNIPGPVKVLPYVPETFELALKEILQALSDSGIPAADLKDLPDLLVNQCQALARCCAG